MYVYVHMGISCFSVSFLGIVGYFLNYAQAFRGGYFLRYFLVVEAPLPILSNYPLVHSESIVSNGTCRYLIIFHLIIIDKPCDYP